MTCGRSFGRAHRTLGPKACSGRPGFSAPGSPKFRLGRVESPVRATVVSTPPDRYFVVKVRRGGPGSAGLSAQTPVHHRGLRPKPRSTTGGSSRNFGAARPKLRLHGADFAARRPPHERSCGRDGPAAYKSSPERVCPRVVPKGRADRDRNGQTPHARAPAGADVMPVGRVSAAPIARSLCRSGVRTTLRARGRLQAVAAGA